MEIDLKLENVSKQELKKITNSDFTYFNIPDSQENFIPTIDDFFRYYNQLFYDIPKEGDNSHMELIENSSLYLNYSPNEEELNALREEIFSLRTENLELNKRILDIQNKNNG